MHVTKKLHVQYNILQPLCLVCVGCQMLGSCLVAVDLLNVKLRSHLPAAVPVKFLCAKALA